MIKTRPTNLRLSKVCKVDRSSIIQKIITEHLDDALFSVENKKPHRRGKVRDIFDANNALIMVNTDRVSAFDQVLGTIPLKGALLCEQAEFWFKRSIDICKNHLIDRPDPQIMLCKKAEPFLVEVIVRGYLAGSLMREDKATRGHCYGLSLDPSLNDYEQFSTPIITPTTKAKVGHHDLPISPKDIVSAHLVSKKHWQAIVDYALALFKLGSDEAHKKGLLLVDTKYEFGLIDDQVYLIDEIHTCDSSRFFIEDDYCNKYKNRTPPLMLDKEFLRQHLLSIGVDQNNILQNGFTLDNNIRLEVAKRYYLLTEKIIGQDFVPPNLGAQNRVDQQLSLLMC